MIEQVGGWGVVVSIVVALGGVIFYLRGTQVKTTINTLKESNGAYEERIGQLREDVDALMQKNQVLESDNAQLKDEIKHIKEIPLAKLVSDQAMALKILENIQTTQTELLKILAAQTPVHVEVNK